MPDDDSRSPAVVVVLANPNPAWRHLSRFSSLGRDGPAARRWIEGGLAGCSPPSYSVQYWLCLSFPDILLLRRLRPHSAHSPMAGRGRGRDLTMPACKNPHFLSFHSSFACLSCASLHCVAEMRLLLCAKLWFAFVL